MAITFENALGLHQHALGLRSKRAEILSANIANADTPQFKAKEFSFDKLLQMRAGTNPSGIINSTHANHITHTTRGAGKVMYRVPSHADTGDANSVDLEQERSNFYQNTLRYQTTFDFLNGKFTGLRKAIVGQ